MKISLNSIEEVKKFTELATKCHGEIDLVSGRYMVDGKSIMGIFSLDLAKPVELKMPDMEEKEKQKFIESLRKNQFEIGER